MTNAPAHDAPAEEASAKSPLASRRYEVSWVDYTILFALAVFWGNSFLLTNWTVQEMAPATLAMLRTLGGGGILLAIAFAMGKKLPGGRTIWVTVFACAVLGNALPFFLIGWGQVLVGAGLGAILMGIMPLFTLLFAHFMTGDERFTWVKAAAVGLGLVGLIILVGPSVLYELGTEGIRQLALVGAAICYSINAIFTKRLTHLDPIMISGLFVTVAGVLLLPVGVPDLIANASVWSASVWTNVVILALLPTALSGILTFVLIGRQGATFFSQINYLVPLSGVAWGWALANEVLEPRAAIALLFIFAGITLSRRIGRARTTAYTSSFTSLPSRSVSPDPVSERQDDA
ncbi:MAG: DMT family transporter [Pseudomonadota bacterium]